MRSVGSMRLGGVGSSASLAALRRAAEASGVARLVADASPSPETPAARPDPDGYDLLCVLEPRAGLLGVVESHGRAGKGVLLAGPPAGEPAALDRLGGAFAASGARLLVGPTLRHGPLIVALDGLVRAGRVGAPVYLRYAAEAGDGASLLWRAADAVDLASRLLGPPRELYAVGVGPGPDELVHLALTLRHDDGALALLGLGVAAGARRPEGVLLLGDRGAAEGDPAAGGLISHDGAPPGRTTALRDERAEALAGWLRAALSRAGGEYELGAELARAGRLAALIAAVRRSLTTGRAEPLDAAPTEDR